MSQNDYPENDSDHLGVAPPVPDHLIEKPLGAAAIAVDETLGHKPQTPLTANLREGTEEFTTAKGREISEIAKAAGTVS